MAGNVYEWVEADDGDDGHYIVHGGAFFNYADDVACSSRGEGVNDSVYDGIAFRVVSPGP
jgi:formylglycine-generating enzyme required for sulfatase activity